MKYLHGKLILFVQKLASEDGFQEGKQIFIFSIGKLQKKKKKFQFEGSVARNTEKRFVVNCELEQSEEVRVDIIYDT